MRIANHCHLSNYARQWIDGELLGDGNLCSQSYLSAHFQYSSKYLEYIHYVADTLSEFGINGGKIYTRTRVKSVEYSYTSLHYVELLDVWIDWYIHGKKEVPKDLRLTPVVCRQWYIGDGCLVNPKRTSVRSYIVLATYGFIVTDVLFLMTELRHLGILATYQQCDNTLRIPADFVKDFLNYIGQCPVKCYQYKWSIK